MPDSAIARVGGVLERLVKASDCALAAVAMLQDEDLLIEQSSPQTSIAGTRLRVPAPLTGRLPARLDTAGIRLPLDWTLACSGRPDYIVILTLGADDRVLVVAGSGAPPPDSLLHLGAGKLTAALASGQGTQRDLKLALQIRDLVDHLPFPVVFIDSRSFDAVVNDPARDLLALRPGAAASANVHIALRAIMAESHVPPETAFASDLTDRVFDLVLDDEQYEVMVRAIERERLDGRLWVFRNVTTEREAARFKDELIANVSHELRTPLTSIAGALSLLKGVFGDAAGPDAARLLDIADANARRLTRLVDDLLDAGRLEARQLEIAPRAVELGWLLADTIELNRPYADRLGIALAYARPRRRCTALVDPERMHQVLGNVLSNAAKFSPRGSTVQVTLEPAGSMARIIVTDQGCGMTPEFQQRLFTRFARAQGEAGRMPGTGLGLTIAKGIVEAMDGSIAVTSRLNEGTAVTIEVPLIRTALAGRGSTRQADPAPPG